MQAFGITRAEHAIHLATWAAGVSYFRRQRRNFANMPGACCSRTTARSSIRCSTASIPSYIIDAEIDSDEDFFALTIDSEIKLPADPFGYLRGRDGMEWGPVGITRDCGRRLLNGEYVAQAESLSGLALEELLNTETQSSTDLVISELPSCRTLG